MPRVVCRNAEVALAQKDAKGELYGQAIAFEPGYCYYHRIYANSLLPVWDGEAGEVEKFRDDAANKIGGTMMFEFRTDFPRSLSNASKPRTIRGQESFSG